MEANIESALSANQDNLLRKKNVVGVARGKRIKNGKETDEEVVVVFVDHKEPLGVLSTRDIIPRELGGVKTDVVETGEFIAYQTPPADRQRKFRPAPGGVSIGHYQITAGTFGCVVKDYAGRRLILSNNHVLANSNNARLGDPILQPGSFDGGKLTDTIGGLEKFVKINFPNGDSDCPVARGIGGFFNFWYWVSRRKTRFRIVVPEAATEPNYVDAALCHPAEDTDIKDEILDIGVPVGTKRAAAGMSVTKSGRTTGTTQGVVQYTGATVRVNYGGGRTATFIDQVIITPGGFSAGGDSGSSVHTIENGEPYLVGLLFAGSSTHTIINRIEHVFRLLEVAL